MFPINRYTLANGLRIVHAFDETTQMVALNLIYDVGSKDENPEKTGFAHLFEHLMFGGSCHIPDYDSPLQNAGGDNNAWTSNDYTNYYLTIPAQNVEIGFWLESDRMLELAFSDHSLQVQRQVVCEEFKERNLNQPYGDVSLLFRPLAYQVHPYRWSTIGKDVSHIEQATIQDVKDFYFKWYAPNNAILGVTGNISFDKVIALSEKWFGPIERRNVPQRHLPQEPIQTESRFLDVQREVPLDYLVKGYHICDRKNADYYVYDLLSDLLSNGDSSRLIQHLVKKHSLFAEVNSYISGDIEPGLLYITGKLLPGVSQEIAERALVHELDVLLQDEIREDEMEKVKNKFEASTMFSQISYLGKATEMAYFELLGNADDMHDEVAKYRNVSVSDVRRVVADSLQESNCSTLFYHH